MMRKGDRHKTSSKLIDLSLTRSKITLNVNSLNTPFKSQRFSGSIKNNQMLSTKNTVKYKDKNRLKVKGWERYANSNQKLLE